MVPCKSNRDSQDGIWVCSPTNASKIARETLPEPQNARLYSLPRVRGKHVAALQYVGMPQDRTKDTAPFVFFGTPTVVGLKQNASKAAAVFTPSLLASTDASKTPLFAYCGLMVEIPT